MRPSRPRSSTLTAWLMALALLGAAPSALACGTIAAFVKGWVVGLNDSASGSTSQAKSVDCNAGSADDGIDRDVKIGSDLFEISADYTLAVGPGSKVTGTTCCISATRLRDGAKFTIGSVTKVFDAAAGTIVSTVSLMGFPSVIVTYRPGAGARKAGQTGAAVVAGVRAKTGQIKRGGIDGFKHQHRQGGSGGQGSWWRPSRSGLAFNTRGIGGGEMDMPVGVWGSFQYASVESDFAPNAFDSDRFSILLGMDTTVMSDSILLGVAIGYQDSDTDTNRLGAVGKLESSGFTVAPYAAVLIDDRWSADLAVGYTDLSSDQTSSLAVTSEIDSTTWFAAGNVTYDYTGTRWLLSTHGGFLLATDDQDDFVDSAGAPTSGTAFRFLQLNVGAELAYSFNRWEPFASALVEYDVSKSDTVNGSPEDDDMGIVLGAGMRFFQGDSFSGSVEYQGVFTRDDIDEHRVNLLLRADF